MTATIQEMVFAAINNSVAALPQRQKADSEPKLASAVGQSFSPARARRNTP